MTGRHEFIPPKPSTQAELEGISPYSDGLELRRFHEAAMAGWDKKPGVHKRSTPNVPLAERAIIMTLATLASAKRLKRQ